MKRLILISTFFTAGLSCFAQTECSKSNPIFKSDNYGAPKEVYTLGSNPEFAFLRNLSTPEQVAAAMKKGKNKHGMEELNSMLMDIGFTNGAKDVAASSITEYTVPSGTMGNMGDGNFNTAFIKLEGNGQGVKSWKISSPTGCYVYVLAKCGNAFYPTKKATACLNVPLNLTGTSKEVTLESGATKTSVQNTYVYYHRKKQRKTAMAPQFADVPDTQASDPVLLNTTKNVEAIPQTYTVNVSTPDNNVKVCEDKPLNVATNISVEKTGEYTGNYPTNTAKQYKEVSRREYRKIDRKMRHAERKEEKVAGLSGVEVNSDVVAVTK